MKIQPINTSELIEALKNCSAHSFSPLEKYSKEQLHATENLLHEAVRYAPLVAIKYLVEQQEVPLFHMAPKSSTAQQEDAFAIMLITQRSGKFHRMGEQSDSAEVYSFLLDQMHKKNPTWASLDAPTSSILDAIVDDHQLNNNQKKDLIIKSLEAGAHINKNHSVGYPSTVLGRALFHKNTDLAKFLIDAGANPDLPEPAIKDVSSPTSIGFDSTGEVRSYVYQINHPTPTDTHTALIGLLKYIANNDVHEIQRHLEKPEFRRLTIDGKNLYQMAQESIPNISPEMQNLLKYNVAPQIQKNQDLFSLHSTGSIKDKLSFRRAELIENIPSEPIKSTTLSSSR